MANHHRRLARIEARVGRPAPPPRREGERSLEARLATLRHELWLQEDQARYSEEAARLLSRLYPSKYPSVEEFVRVSVAPFERQAEGLREQIATMEAESEV